MRKKTTDNPVKSLCANGASKPQTIDLMNPMTNDPDEIAHKFAFHGVNK